MESLIYDGTFVGFLNLLHYLLHSPNLSPKTPILNRRLHPEAKGLLFYREIPSREELAREFLVTLEESLGSEVKEKIFLYYLCDTAELEWPLTRVILKARQRRDIFQNITDDDVIKLHSSEREFYRERHRFYGLLRFYQIPRGPLIAPFEPKFNVLPKLFPHFVRRFPKEDFIIVDMKRNLVFTYHRGERRLFWVENFELEIDASLDPYIALWRKYFSEIAVPERLSYERQRSKVPLRVRKFLPEFWEKI